MDFTGWPIWLIFMLLILTNQYFNKILMRGLSLLGIASQKRDDKELEAERWMREQSEKTAERAFGILESTIRDFRKQSEGRDKTMIDMIVSIQKNTEVTRLLAQKVISVENLLKDIRTSLVDTQHIESPAND